MKRVYQNPQIKIVVLKTTMSMLILSAGNLEGFGGYGGDATGKSADGRGYDFDDEEE